MSIRAHARHEAFDGPVGAGGRRLSGAAASAIFGGMAALGVAYGVSSDQPLIAAGIVAMVGAAILCVFPGLVLWLTLATGLVVAGLTKLYAPAIQELRWAAVPLALVLVGHTVLARLSPAPGNAPAAGSPPVLRWALVVVSTVAVTALVALPDPVQLARGLKGYFQVWGLLLGLALLSWPEQTMRRRLPLVLLWVALLQLPFVAQQFLVLVPHREALAAKGVVPEDVIGGTFGAQAEGGGANAMLAIYMFVVLAGVCGLWQRGVVSGMRFALLSVPLLVPLLLNQAKASLVYLIVLFPILFGHEIRARPARFAGIGIVAALVLGGMLTAYTVGLGKEGVQSWSDLVAATYASNIEADQENRGTFTRAGALRYWVEQHVPGDPFGALLGHGVYASRTGAEGADVLWETADRSLGIKNTAISALLWDAGLLGLGVVLLLLASAYATANRLAARYQGDAWLGGLFWGARGAVAVLTVSLLLKSYFTYHLAFQTLFAVLVGWLAYWDRRRPPPAAIA